MQLIMKPLCWYGAVLAFCSMTLGAAAQGLFSPAITVNDSVISYYELEQRTLFLDLLRAPGDPEKLAREQLISDRLKQQAINQVGFEIAPEDIEAGMDEFAGRADLERDEFIQALAQGGVSEETFRDFVEIGISWRDYVQARFIGQARPSDAEIDRALGRDGGGSGVRVLLSEIIIPRTPENAEEVAGLMQELSQITSFSEFSEAAQRFSATETRDRGGQLEWIAANELPPALRSVILELNPGEVTEPVLLPEATAVFQMRDIQEIVSGTPRYAAIDYATYAIPGGRSAEALQAAAEVSARIDTCDDLYGIAKDQPPERLQRESLPPAEIPRDIALELAKLDRNEISTNLTSAGGQNLILLMLCGRTAELNEDSSREDVANALTQQRLNAFAASFLQQLEADAIIVEQ